MLRKWKEYEDPKYSKIAYYVIKTALILALLGLILYWAAGKAAGVFSFVTAVLNPLILGMVLAYLFSPLVQKCEDKLFQKIRKPGLKRGLSVAMTFGLVLVILLVGIGVLVVVLTRSISAVNLHDLDKTLEYLKNEFASFGTLLEEKLAGMNFSIGTLGGFATKLFGSVKEVASGFLFSCIFAIYFLMDSGIKEYWADIIHLFTSEKTREKLTELGRDADHVFSGYIRGQAIDALIVGGLATIVLSVARIPYAPVVGLLTGIGNLIPYVGPIVGFGSLIVVCLLEGSILHLAIGGVILALVMFVDGNIINPRLLSANVEVHPVLVILALIAGGQVGGVLGMLVGVPCAAFLKLQFDKIVEKKRREQGGTPQICADSQNRPTEEQQEDRKDV